MASLVSISVARHQATCELCSKTGRSEAEPASAASLWAQLRALLSLRSRA